MKNNSKIKLIILVAIFCVISLISLYSIYIEPKSLVLENIEFSFDDLPQKFDGYKIALLSDLHYGDGTPAEIIERSVTMANDQKPDIVLLAGDFISASQGAPDSNENIASCVEILKKLISKDGIIAVLGNHDQWGGAEKVEKALTDAKVNVLRNNHVRISKDNEYIYILGVDDLYWGGGNIEKSRVGMKYPDAFKILLSHIPDAIFEAKKNGIPLVLSGHTHGGQIKFPFYKWYIKGRFIFSDFISGRYDVDGSVLYVTRGIGTAWPPARFLAKPEVTIITLKKGSVSLHPIYGLYYNLSDMLITATGGSKDFL